MKSIIVLLCLVVLGCVSTGGPFVTSVSSAGDSKLSIEKCTFKFNSFSGSVSAGECHTEQIVVAR